MEPSVKRSDGPNSDGRPDCSKLEDTEQSLRAESVFVESLGCLGQSVQGSSENHTSGQPDEKGEDTGSRSGDSRHRR